MFFFRIIGRLGSKDGAVKTVFMRKSLKEGAGGMLENLDITKLVGILGAAAVAAKFALDAQ